MSDDSKCMWAECPKKDKCARYRPSDKPTTVQTWFYIGIPDHTEGECNVFVPSNKCDD